MKQLFYLLLLATVIMSCSNQKFAVRANNDHLMENNLNQTYQIVIGQSEAKLSEETERAIQDEVENQMEARGFVRTSKSPDIVVVCSVFETKLKIKDSRKLEEDKSEYTTRRITLNGGTLMIQMIDENLNKSVWLGMASGFIKPNKSIEERQLKAITRSIFDEYKLVAYGYMPKQEMTATR